MSKKILSLLAVLVGVVLLGLAVMYFLTPANSLPSFIPGADPTVITPHFKHGIGTLLLGLGALVFAWFQTGKKSA